MSSSSCLRHAHSSLVDGQLAKYIPRVCSSRCSCSGDGGHSSGAASAAAARASGALFAPWLLLAVAVPAPTGPPSPHAVRTMAAISAQPRRLSTSRSHRSSRAFALAARAVKRQSSARCAGSRLRGPFQGQPNL